MDHAHYEAQLTALAARVSAADAAASAARADRDELIRAAIKDGMTMYRIAQLVGVRQQNIRTIRDAVQ